MRLKLATTWTLLANLLKKCDNELKTSLLFISGASSGELSCWAGRQLFFCSFQTQYGRAQFSGLSFVCQELVTVRDYSLPHGSLIPPFLLILVQYYNSWKCPWRLACRYSRYNYLALNSTTCTYCFQVLLAFTINCLSRSTSSLRAWERLFLRYPQSSLTLLKQLNLELPPDISLKHLAHLLNVLVSRGSPEERELAQVRVRCCFSLHSLSCFRGSVYSHILTNAWKLNPIELPCGSKTRHVKKYSRNVVSILALGVHSGGSSWCSWHVYCYICLLCWVKRFHWNKMQVAFWLRVYELLTDKLACAIYSHMMYVSHVTWMMSQMTGTQTLCTCHLWRKRLMIQ